MKSLTSSNEELKRTLNALHGQMKLRVSVYSLAMLVNTCYFFPLRYPTESCALIGQQGPVSSMYGPHDGTFSSRVEKITLNKKKFYTVFALFLMGKLVIQLSWKLLFLEKQIKVLQFVITITFSFINCSNAQNFKFVVSNSQNIHVYIVFQCCVHTAYVMHLHIN